MNTTFLPERIKSPLRRLRDLVIAPFYAGNARFCPVCGRSSGKFRTAGATPRPDAQCVHCGALERHRLFWLFVSRKTDLFKGEGKTLLHFAPEPCFETRFRQRLGTHYITADLHNPVVMVRMDITDIQYPDRSFDAVYCSHVLEHVEHDKKAMREIHRVLKDDGWAVVLVPITAEKTLEDPSITDPADRMRVYGQADHVRRYGPDFVDRLRHAGFSVKIITTGDLVDNESAVKLGLTAATGDIYFCTKART